jgi:hypothetical protein
MVGKGYRGDGNEARYFQEVGLDMLELCCKVVLTSRKSRILCFE